jgi:DNA-binding CsgD family transcriptional regulator
MAIRILIVDDDARFLGLAAESLAERGFDVLGKATDAAREHLHRADEMLRAMGAAGFAERARRELLATGENVRKRTAGTARDLTPQEMQIAMHARGGRTNREIGAELFLSSRTVEWHLHNVCAKLGITSRRQLRDALPDAAKAMR